MKYVTEVIVFMYFLTLIITGSLLFNPYHWFWIAPVLLVFDNVRFYKGRPRL